jgi:tetratricopeptide (TPR) repeat protein
MARRPQTAFRRKGAGAVQQAARAHEEPRPVPLTAAAEWWGFLAIALATIAVFARSVPYPFQRSWDDGRFILDNQDVLHPSVDALGRFFSEPRFEAFHPLHLLAYWLDVPWSNATPWVVHATSLGLWVIGLWFLYAALRALAITPWVAVLGTLACGLHPVQVEAVVWATGRKDVLALLFASASLWSHLRAASAWDRFAWLSRVCYVLALLSKTTALPLPLVIIAIDLARGVASRRAVLRQLPSFAIAIAAGVAVIVIWRENVMVRTTVGGASLAPLRVVQTLGHQLLTAVWPSHTSPMYATQRVIEIEPSAFIAVGTWIMACVAAWRTRARLVLAGLVGFGFLMLPVSNLVPMYFTLQDRYLSLPLASLALAFAAFVDSAGVHRKNAALVATAIIAVLGLRTMQYAGVWESETRLWGHAASTQPDADYAWLKLGEVRREAGELEGAIAAYQTAIHVAPLRRLAHAALFESVARRDERIAGISPSNARALAQRYYEQVESQQGLQELASYLLQRGYTRTVELPLQVIIARDKIPDDALQKIARAQLKQGRRSVARFYAASMQRKTEDPELLALLGEFSFRVLP